MFNKNSTRNEFMTIISHTKNLLILFIFTRSFLKWFLSLYTSDISKKFCQLVRTITACKKNFSLSILTFKEKSLF